MLDELEAAGGPHNPREILKIFIDSAVIPDDDPRALSNVRLFRLAFLDNPNLVLETVGNPSKSAYIRCLKHLASFMSDMDKTTRERRFYLLQEYVFGVLSSRERELTTGSPHANKWDGSGMLDELVTTSEALLFV